MSPSKKSLNGGIWLLSELLIIKIDLDIAQSEKKYSKSKIHTNVSQSISFFDKAELFIFVNHLKQDNYYPISLQPVAIDFLSIYVSFSNAEAWFLYKTWLYCIDFPISINKYLDKKLTKLGWVMNIWDLMKFRSFWSFKFCFFSSFCHWCGGC